MNIRILFLVTGAAFALLGRAQAADLSVAEPVDYVKVCDAYGAGYWYIPGTDTCIRIGGYAKFILNFTHDSTVYDDPSTSGSAVLNWRFSHEFSVNVTAQSVTDWGKAVAFIDYRVTSGNKYSVGSNVYLDSGYFSIGGLAAGYRASRYDTGGGYTDFGVFRSDSSVDQISYSLAMGAWGLTFSVESPYTNRWADSATGDMPDLVLALNGASGPLSWWLAAAATDRVGGTGYGVDGAIQADLGGGAKIKVGGAWSHDAPSFGAQRASVLVTGGEGDVWSAFVSGVVALNSTVGLAASFSHLDEALFGSRNLVEVDLTFALAKNTTGFIEGVWNDNGAAADTWGANVVLQQSFGS
jgi:hypothetical protein